MTTVRHELIQVMYADYYESTVRMNARSVEPYRTCDWEHLCVLSHLAISQSFNWVSAGSWFIAHLLSFNRSLAPTDDPSILSIWRI